MAVETIRPTLFPECATCPVAGRRIVKESEERNLGGTKYVTEAVAIECTVENARLGLVDMGGWRDSGVYEGNRRTNYSGSRLPEKSVDCPHF